MKRSLIPMAVVLSVVSLSLNGPSAYGGGRGGGGGHGGGWAGGGHGWSGGGGGRGWGGGGCTHFGSMAARGGQTFTRSGMGTWSGQRWGGRNWNGNNWSGQRWGGGHWNNWNRNGNHHNNNNVIFIGDFGFPLWWGWGYPYYGDGYGYPYGYGYGNGYGYPYGGTTTAITAALTTGMATRLEGTRTAITAARATKMAIPPIQEWRSCNADLRGPGITLAQSMESLGLRRGEQLTLTSANMDLQANRGITECDAIDPPIFQFSDEGVHFGPVASRVSLIEVVALPIAFGSAYHRAPNGSISEIRSTPRLSRRARIS